LVNAIYFKGAWATPFPEFATKPDMFYPKSGANITVPFMHKRGNFSYGENDQLQLLALPYVGRQLQMIILLPRDRDGIGRLEGSLNPANLASWLALAKDQNVNVALPKFKVSTDLKLSETLKGMGMKDAFDADRADFSGMDGVPHWLYVSAVLHKAYIDVNEKGTEAAAATAVAMMARGIAPPSPPPREFRADHPFLFLIHDSTTGSILFLGRISQPGSD
jgi:serpin B